MVFRRNNKKSNRTPKEEVMKLKIIIGKNSLEYDDSHCKEPATVRWSDQKEYVLDIIRKSIEHLKQKQ